MWHMTLTGMPSGSCLFQKGTKVRLGPVDVSLLSALQLLCDQPLVEKGKGYVRGMYPYPEPYPYSYP